MKLPTRRDEARRLAALNLALVNLPKNTKTEKILELAQDFELYLFDGSMKEPELPEE